MHITGDTGAAWPQDDGHSSGPPTAEHPRLAELSELYRTRHQHFNRFFLRAGLPTQVAQDLTQDTFMAGIDALAKFKGDSLLFTWLWRIAINQLNAHLRAADRRVDCLGSAEEVHAACPPSLTESPEFTLNTKQRKLYVRQQFARFTREHPERAMALSMSIDDAADAATLAQWLGRSPGAAREYLSQCRKALRPYLQGLHDET